MDITFKDKTGKTQGIKFNMNPPINAKNKNFKIFGSNLILLNLMKFAQYFFHQIITNSIGFFKFFQRVISFK